MGNKQISELLINDYNLDLLELVIPLRDNFFMYGVIGNILRNPAYENYVKKVAESLKRDFKITPFCKTMK